MPHTKQFTVTDYDMDKSYIIVSIERNGREIPPAGYETDVFERWLEKNCRLCYELQGSRKIRTMSIEQYWENTDEQQVMRDLEDFIAGLIYHDKAKRMPYVPQSIVWECYDTINNRN